MTDIFTNWLLLIAVFSLAVISPGPDFIMVIRNSLTASRRAGLFTALGLGCGVIVHVTYTLAGLAAMIANSILLFSILKYAGAAYLVYVGMKCLRSRGMAAPEVGYNSQIRFMTNFQALRSGFITNLFNPKATMFFLALFSQILHPDYHMVTRLAFGTTCVAMVTGWFSLVAVVMTTPAIKERFFKMSKWIDRLCGSMFIALGLRLALTTKALP